MRLRALVLVLLLPAFSRAGGIAVDRLLAIGECGRSDASELDCAEAARALDDSDATLRLAGALALEAGALAHAIPVAPAARALDRQREDVLVALALLDALRRARASGEDVARACEAAASSSNARVAAHARSVAAAVREGWSSPAGLRDLLAFGGDEPPERLARAAQEMGAGGTAVVGEVARDARVARERRIRAVRTLQALGPPSLEALAGLVGDPMVGSEAADALARLGAPELDLARPLLSASSLATVEDMAASLLSRDEGSALVDEALAAADAPHRQAIVTAACRAQVRALSPRLLREAVRLAGVSPELEDVEDAFRRKLDDLAMPDRCSLGPRVAASLALDESLPDDLETRLELLTRDPEVAVARAARLVLAGELGWQRFDESSARLLVLLRERDDGVRAAALLALRASCRASGGHGESRDPSELARTRILAGEAQALVGSADPVLRRAAAHVLFEALEEDPGLSFEITRALEDRVADPPETHVLLAAIRFALQPGELSLREALVARTRIDALPEGALRRTCEARMPGCLEAVASIMASCSDALFVEAWSLAQGLASASWPVEACTAALESPDARVREAAALCLADAGLRARPSLDCLAATLEREVDERSLVSEVHAIVLLASGDVALQDRALELAHRRGLADQLGFSLRSAASAEWSRALRSNDEALRVAAVAELLRAAPGFAQALARARDVATAGHDAEATRAVSSLMARPDREPAALESLELSALPRARAERVRLLASLSRDRVPALAHEALRDGSSEVRLAGLRALVQLGRDAPLPARTCHDPDVRVRRELAGILAQGWSLEGEESAQLDCEVSLLADSEEVWTALLAGRARVPDDDGLTSTWRRSVELPLALRRAERAGTLHDARIRPALAALAGSLAARSVILREPLAASAAARPGP